MPLKDEEKKAIEEYIHDNKQELIIKPVKNWLKKWWLRLGLPGTAIAIIGAIYGYYVYLDKMQSLDETIIAKKAEAAVADRTEKIRTDFTAKISRWETLTEIEKDRVLDKLNKLSGQVDVLKLNADNAWKNFGYADDVSRKIKFEGLNKVERLIDVLNTNPDAKKILKMASIPNNQVYTASRLIRENQDIHLRGTPWELVSIEVALEYEADIIISYNVNVLCKTNDSYKLAYTGIVKDGNPRKKLYGQTTKIIPTTVVYDQMEGSHVNLGANAILKNQKAKKHRFSVFVWSQDGDRTVEFDTLEFRNKMANMKGVGTIGASICVVALYRKHSS